MKRKWRPALWMVVFGVLLVVALLPLAGLLAVMGFEYVSGQQFALRSLLGMSLLALGSLVTAGLIGAVFLRTLLRPLQELEARTAEIEAGRTDAFREIDRAGTREVATVGERFFALARKLSQRSEYLTLFTTHLSHELKTPLTSIQGAAELIRSSGADMSNKQRSKFLANIVDDTERLADLSTRLRELARAEVATTGGASAVREVVSGAVREAGLKLEWSGEDASVAMSAENAGIVWKQLVRNAKEQGAKQLLVTAQREAGTARILVGDDGVEISPANREQMFDAFFTTRRTEGGTGMGLGIARAMLNSHGGEIVLADGGEAKFVVTIPRSTE